MQTDTKFHKTVDNIFKLLVVNISPIKFNKNKTKGKKLLNRMRYSQILKIQLQKKIKTKKCLYEINTFLDNK